MNIDSTHTQLVLPISKRKQTNLDNFISGENEQVLNHIRSILDGSSPYEQTSQRISVVTSNKSAGKTHLLIGACDYAEKVGLSSQYMDLELLKNMPPEILSTYCDKSLLCIDNLQMVEKSFEWQKAVFDVINQFIENDRHLLLIASTLAPENIEYSLPDLKTRLAWGINFSLFELNDLDKQHAISMHLASLGLVFSEDIVPFIFKRCTRDMSKIDKLVQTLDEASLQNKRKITIPFIKQILSI